MRKLVLSALLLSAFPLVSLGQVTEGEWTYIVENGGATITASTATGAVTIPSELGGYAVKKLADEPLFNPIFGYGNTSVTSVVILNSLTRIGTGAFVYCYGLTSITIPNSVTSIGNNAFAYCTSLASITIPNSVTSIESEAFYFCSALTTLTIPNSVTSIGPKAFNGCSGLTSVTMPDRFISQVAQIGLEGQVATDYLVNALANNDAFVTAVANKIKSTGGNYGIATQSGLSSAITTAVEPLATKSELTSSLTQSRTDGINSVLSNPNLWTLYTTSQIQNMAVGDLVLTKNVGGTFTLNYDIEQSTDLQNWTPYQALSLPLTGLPTDKAFVRIKMINSSSNSGSATPIGSNF